MDGSLGILARARAALARLARITKSPASDAGQPCPYRPSHLADAATRVSFAESQLPATPTYARDPIAQGYAASAHPVSAEARSGMPLRVYGTTAGRPLSTPTDPIASAAVTNTEPRTVAASGTAPQRSAPTADKAAAEVKTATNTEPVEIPPPQASSFPARKPECR